MVSHSRLSALLLSFSALGLTSCAYVMDKSHQDITVVTPGAENAYCDLYIDKLRYQVNPPQTINIMKSSSDMEVKCRAPGNRSQSVTVPAKFTKKAIWGTPAGMAWDYASQSLYYYPNVVAVDFSLEKTKANPHPHHNSSDVDQPESHYLEEYLPGEPKLNSDKNKKVDPIKRRDEDIEETAVETPINEPTDTSTDKGNLSTVIERINAKSEQEMRAAEKMMTPMPADEPALEDGVFTPVPSNSTDGSAPVQLYPGQ